MLKWKSFLKKKVDVIPIKGQSWTRFIGLQMYIWGLGSHFDLLTYVSHCQNETRIWTVCSPRHWKINIICEFCIVNPYMEIPGLKGNKSLWKKIFFCGKSAVIWLDLSSRYLQVHQRKYKCCSCLCQIDSYDISYMLSRCCGLSDRAVSWHISKNIGVLINIHSASWTAKKQMASLLFLQKPTRSCYNTCIQNTT